MRACPEREGNRLGPGLTGRKDLQPIGDDVGRTYGAPVSHTENRVRGGAGREGDHPVRAAVAGGGRADLGCAAVGGDARIAVERAGMVPDVAELERVINAAGGSATETQAQPDLRARWRAGRRRGGCGATR